MLESLGLQAAVASRLEVLALGFRVSWVISKIAIELSLLHWSCFTIEAA